MEPRTRERRAYPSSTVKNGARSAVSMCLFLTCVIATGAILLVSAAPCIAAMREHTVTELSSAVEPPVSPCGTRADEFFGVRGEIGDLDGRGLRSVGEETLWIFDADFEDLMGDNAGWTSLDMSGTPEQVNYWHKDTIRINGFEHLGDSTWWCGTYNDCWRQPRGYGNDWVCTLSRELPLASWSDPGNDVVLEWDQRCAMEFLYDYGYVDVRAPGDSSWTTRRVITNPGFHGHPGMSQDWDSLNPMAPGHDDIDLSGYAGEHVQIRFRFESDEAYSSQDQYNNPGFNSCLDGAWQLDNFTLTVNDTVRWYDDCESPGSNGWQHDGTPASGQTGVVFERVFEPDILRPGGGCWWGARGWWMTALDAETGVMVDGQDSWLISPPIDIAGVDGLVAEWLTWVDCERYSNDRLNLWISTSDDPACVHELSLFVDESPGNWYGGPYFTEVTDPWDIWIGDDWLAFAWQLFNDEPPDSGAVHRTGLMLGRQRVGVPVGGPPTVWYYSSWDMFRDTFDITEALSHETGIDISDEDGIVSAFIVVSSDLGQSWESLPLIDETPENDWWIVPPLDDYIAPATEIRYYFEATDGTGNVRTHPRNAPSAYYEFSILPIVGSIEEPAILLVDKHGRKIPGKDGSFRHTSEYYFTEALDILGFEYDVYDVPIPGSMTELSNGPDTSGMKYYDTVVWFTNDLGHYYMFQGTVSGFDQRNLIAWLGQSAEGKERNLLVTGNDIGADLMEASGETLAFYTQWLGSEYVQDDPADVNNDTLLIVRDAVGEFSFMTHDDSQCPLRLLVWDDW